MGTSRDEQDPRDLMRAMNHEARAEFEAEEAHDAGGASHQSRLDREGVPGDERPVEAATRDATEATRAQDDADPLRVPRGEPTGGDASGDPPAAPSSTPGGE
jgi:hypothetical protein